MKQEETQTDERVNAVDQMKRPNKRNEKKDAKEGKNGTATKGRIAADVEEQSNIGKKNAKHNYGL